MKKITITIGMLLVLVVGTVLWQLSVKKRQQPVSQGPVKVVASFYPLGEFAKAVGGDQISVMTVVPGGIEPHEYEPTPRDLAQAYEAQLFVFNGAGVDPWAEKIRSELESKGVKTLDMTSFFELRQSDISSTGSSATATDCLNDTSNNNAACDSGQQGNQSQFADPHIWLDPVLAKRQVELIVNALVEIDPAHKDVFVRNTDDYMNRLDALDGQYTDQLKQCSLHKVIVSHDAFGYLADRYGFEIIPVAGLSPGAEPSIKQIADLAKLIKDENISSVFFETLASPKFAQTLAAETGAQALVLDPIEGLTPDEIANHDDYLSIMERNLTNLKVAMKCE